MAVSYANQNATRNQPLNPFLEQKLKAAVEAVYGPGYSAQVYSGGQAAKGEGPRVGSVRHDHGKAGDIYVLGPDGKKVTGDGLAPLGQYWAANKIGGVGMEMRGGGIHLDMWDKPPPGGGMSWNYANQGGQFTPAQQAAVQAGLQGQAPAMSSQIAAQPASPPQAPGTPAPPLPPPRTISDSPVMAMAPTAAPQAPQGPQPPSERMMQILGSMAVPQSQQPQFAPVQMQGPSPQQAQALTSFIQALKSRGLGIPT